MRLVRLLNNIAAVLKIDPQDVVKYIAAPKLHNIWVIAFTQNLNFKANALQIPLILLYVDLLYGNKLPRKERSGLFRIVKCENSSCWKDEDW